MMGKGDQVNDGFDILSVFFLIKTDQPKTHLFSPGQQGFYKAVTRQTCSPRLRLGGAGQKIQCLIQLSNFA